MTYEPFEILVVPFPFSDRDASKRRPALVISNHHFNTRHSHLILSMITTSHRAWSSDIALQDWQASGLSAACQVRLKLFTLDKDIIIRKIGILSSRDQAAVEKNICQYLVGMGNSG
jgi:mRNA interferase MazF